VTHDAGCPPTSGDTALLTCDLWEHAYYLDYRNPRARYLDALWKVANWRSAEGVFEERLSSSAHSASRAISVANP
jgi:Fe-Mn family superoxide dismutase